MLNDRYRLKDREPVSRRVYRNLREAIISGDLPPNTRIVEGEFARLLGVSRTPLREALSRLEIDGLVSQEPGTGYSTNDTQRQLEDIFHLRKALEGYAARLVAETATAGLVDRLRVNIKQDRALKLKQTDARAQLDEAFHGLINDACPSAKVRERVIGVCDCMLGRNQMPIRPTREVVKTFLDDHERLADAIAARDGDAAEAAVHAHLSRTLTLLLADRDARLARRKVEGTHPE
jgi:GntR family transcriptional regulator, vanillate catabolism transcriptional regulator